jgi:type VI protein secretion system component VasF
MSKQKTGSTRPHKLRPSAADLDAAFEAHKASEHVRKVHGLYIDAAIALLSVAARLGALNEASEAAAVEGLVVLLEQHATRHIHAIGLRLSGNGGGDK